MVSTSRTLTITALRPSASLADAVRTHWREYLIEAFGLAVLMLCTCALGTVLYSRESPIQALALPPLARASLMGAGTAATAFLLIRSPLGRRSGAHFNPAITLTYLWLKRVHRWDAVCYIAVHFAGGALGVLAASEILGPRLAAVPVRFVVTLPGSHGAGAAFFAEYLMSAVLMGVVLVVTNHRRLTQFSPFFVAFLTDTYFALFSTISGFSVNPARTFSSAAFARIWDGIWIYFAAPCLGMLTAAIVYVHTTGRDRVYCAKVFHDFSSPCPFFCRFHEIKNTNWRK